MPFSEVALSESGEQRNFTSATKHGLLPLSRPFASSLLLANPPAISVEGMSSKSSLAPRQFSAIELEEAGDWKQPSKGSADYRDPNTPAKAGWWSANRAGVEKRFWMVLPILMHLAAIGTLAGAMVTRDFPFLTVTEVLGTGRIDYGIFSESLHFLEIMPC